MAKNTGFQQAIYAAKFTTKGNIPLDRDGNFCSLSGQKQAIILLEGHENPDLSKYEVVGSFTEGEVIDNHASIVYNIDACPLPEPELPELPKYVKEPIESRYFEVRPNTTTLKEDAIKIEFGGFGSLTFVPICNEDFDDPTGIATDPVGFEEGGNVQETLKVRRIGEYYWTLENFKINYTPNGSLSQYILKQSQLDNAGIPLTIKENIQKSGTFFYGSNPSIKYFDQLKTYPQRTLPTKTNPNYWDKSLIQNIVPNNTGSPIDFNFVQDNDWATIILPNRLFTNQETASNQYRAITIWREDPDNTEIRISRMYTEFIDINTTYNGSVNDIDNQQSYIDGMTTYTPGYRSISVKLNGRKFEELPKIKIEYGNVYTGWTEGFFETEEKGWTIPDRNDFLQLFGMVGKDLSYLNLRKNLFVKPIDTDIPWINNYPASEQCEDLLGVRFLPIGAKNNGVDIGVNGKDGEIYNYGQKIEFLTKDEISSVNGSSPALWLTDTNKAYERATVVWDIYNVTTSDAGGGSAQFWQKNVRLCKALSDEELGYRLWVDEDNDKILVTTLDDIQPENTIELDKGLLRGLAVRWMNEDKTKVLVALSKLQAEIEKTKNNGEYKWYGFLE